MNVVIGNDDLDQKGNDGGVDELSIGKLVGNTHEIVSVGCVFFISRKFSNENTQSTVDNVDDQGTDDRKKGNTNLTHSILLNFILLTRLRTFHRQRIYLDSRDTEN